MREQNYDLGFLVLFLLIRGRLFLTIAGCPLLLIQHQCVARTLLG